VQNGRGSGFIEKTTLSRNLSQSVAVQLKDFFVGAVGR